MATSNRQGMSTTLTDAILLLGRNRHVGWTTSVGSGQWLFCGSDRGGERAAILYTLIGTAKLNDIDPQAWLADVLERIAAHPIRDLDALLPWNWQPSNTTADRAAA